MSNHSFIIAAKRSPVTPLGGALSTLNTHQLSTPVINALFESCNIKSDQVDELIVGNALGAGGNPARVIALASGLPTRVAGLSIDRQCCGGLDAILIANDMVQSGRASVVIAGGAESYSMRPKRLAKTSEASHWEEYDQPPFTPWPERDPDMSVAAHALAEKLDISFDQQNQWAVESHHKAIAASKQLTTDIVALNETEQDTFTRKLSLTLCQRAPRIYGTISTANTSVAADGAAYCLVVNESIAKSFNGHKLRIHSGATLGSNPELPGIAPLSAINETLATNRLLTTDLQRIEIMEAYAAQAIACIEQAGIDAAICNVGGGSLARGHPIGASGAILMTRLFHELQATKGFGLATIAAAGGLGTAVLVEATD